MNNKNKRINSNRNKFRITKITKYKNSKTN